MFGYHDVNNCVFDLWTHNEDETCVSNRAFSGFAYHTQEIEDIIEAAVAAYHRGEDEFDITSDSFLSEEDYDYIAAEVERRIN